MRDQGENEVIELLTPPQAAYYLSVAEATLAKWRLVGGGPVYRKIGRRAVRYAKHDLDAFVGPSVKTTREAREVRP